MTSEVTATQNEVVEDLKVGAPEQGITPEMAQAALQSLSADELFLLNWNSHDPKKAQGAADQFRHYINKKAKRLKAQAKAEAKAKKASITSEGASQS